MQPVLVKARLQPLAGFLTISRRIWLYGQAVTVNMCCVKMIDRKTNVKLRRWKAKFHKSKGK